MPLSPDQDELLKQNLLKGFGAPQAPQTAGGFDVSSMGPNLDTALKTVPKAPPAPVNAQDIPPAAEPMGMPPLPPAATPTGAPAPRDTDPKIGSSHPGLTPDEIQRYLSSQRDQINKYGPDQEQMVMDEIRKRQHGLVGKIGDKMAQASDDIMQGVARAGSGQAMARRNEMKQHEIDNAMKLQEDLHKNNAADMATKQGLDQMDPGSPIGRAMASTWGPMLDKLGIPKEQQAKMIPALMGSVVPEQVKMKEAEARIQAAKENRGLMLGMREDQFDQNQWVKLGDKVNSLNAGSRKALGIAASANMRADRNLETLSDPKIVKSPQLVLNVVADIEGIYKQGTPDELMIKHGQYPSLLQDLARIKAYLSAKPEEGATKGLIDQLKQITLGLKQIDNKVISDNLGVNAEVFEPIIRKDPARWARLTGAVMNTTANPGDKGGIGGSSGAQGSNEVLRQTKDGKTAVFDASTKQFLRYQ